MDVSLNQEMNKAESPTVGQTELQAALTTSEISALRKYQNIVSGSPSLFTLLKYELLTGLFGSIPGAAGLVLRKQFFRRLFKKVGRNVLFGRAMTLRHPQKVTIGDNVIFDDYAVLDAKGTDNQGIVLGNNVMVGRNTVLSCKNGNITIGDNTNIAMNCFIQSAKEVHIGKNVLFAAYCYVIGGGDHRTDRTDIPIIAQGQVVKGITIEDNCWLGAGVKILDGVVIGRDSIIGSGAVVTKDIPQFSVALGVPARVIRMRSNFESKEESY